ncbi:nucleoside-diphosphate sugar epimerase/dehydratase [Paenibacillus sp. strain BS8-2]
MEWAEISKLHPDLQSVIIDFNNVLCLRKVDTTETFNFYVYDVLKKMNLLSLAIGKANYSKLRTWHYEKLITHIVEERKLLEIELKQDSFLMYVNPYILPYIKNLNHVYIRNNTKYTNKDVITLLQDKIDPSNFGKLKVINNVEDDTSYGNALYITEQDYKEDNICSIRYDLSAESEIDLESMLYVGFDRKFYKLRKAIEKSPSCSNNFFKIGSLYLGPVLLCFIKLVVDDLTRKNISLILPLMREGDLLNMCLERYIKKRNHSIHSEKLYVSRKSTYLPSLYKDSSVESVLHFFEGINLSIRDLYNLFGLEVLETPYSDKNFYQIKKCNSEEYLRIKRHFTENVNSADFREFINLKKELIEHYITQIVGDHKKVATIDIGFNGTIQGNLNKVFYNMEFEHYLLFGREGLLNKIVSGININAFINSGDHHFVKDIIRGVHALEQIIIGTEGSTLDYEMKNNMVLPVQEELTYNSEEINARNKIQDGVRYFIDIALDAGLDYEINIEDLIAVSKSVHRLLNYPTKQEAIDIGKMHYSINFGSSSVQPIINEKDINQYSIDDIYAFLKGSELSSNIVWPQGILGIKDHEYIYKNLLNSDIFEIYSKIKEVMKDVADRNIVIYGGGEAAYKVHCTLKIKSIIPIYFVDRNLRLQGTDIEGIPIVAPNHLLNTDIDYIIIASYTFGEEIEKDLQVLFQSHSKPPQLIRID